MSDLYGKKMQAARAKLFAGELTKRLGFGLLFGLVVAGVSLWIFSPPGMVRNLWDVILTTIVVKVRELLLLGLRREDVWEHAKALVFLKRFAPEWVKLFWTYGVSAGGMTLVLCAQFWSQNKGSHGLEYRRGSRLLKPVAHNVFMRLHYRKKPPHKMGIPLRLGVERVIIPETLQYRHFAFMGAAGYGKSTAIEEILSHAREARQKCFVVDLNGIFFSRFGSSGDHLLSLRDHRSESWSFWSEVAESDSIFPENMAAALIEEEGGGHQYFWKGARALLASLLRLNTSINELDQDLRRPVGALRKKLQEAGEISARVLGDQDGDQADGIMGTTALDFAFLSELKLVEPHGNEKGFSISEWVKDDKDRSWVFLSVREQDLEQTRPLIRLWFDLACLACLQRSPDDPASPHLWLVVDEVKSLGRLPTLPGILDKGRKYKTSVVLGFQALSQLKKIYGEADATSILQGLQNQFFFRMTEPSCSEYVSRMIGSEEVDETSIAVSFGGNHKRGQGSLNESRRERRLVMPEEVRGLETLQAFGKICHHHPLKLHFEVTERPRVQNPFVPRVLGGKKNVDFSERKMGVDGLGVQDLSSRTGAENLYEDDFLG